MNTSNIKKYAPIARRDFMAAVAQRLNQFGISNSTLGLQVSEPVISGSVMQIDGNLFDAAFAPRRARLVARAERVGFEPLVELVAYTWFNRLCAIRFMELKEGYLEHGFRVLSHPEKPNGFEILDHAQDVALELGLNRDYLIELKLAGNKDEELYRELLLGQCHQLHQAMPFLFEALDDETELLLPDNLIRTDSVLRGLVDEIPEEDWLQVEVIGWLYQFYISEKKDQVIGKVVKSEDIPAATQLFTPNWIVKYLVQNSVGRKWLQTYPDSSIKGQMEYYIEPAVQTDEVQAQLEAITPASIEPESIKVLDPACGSGHILVEAYNVLKAIYEERGYRSRDIPKLILENNIFGLDIDDRAAQLAGFALMMMARNDDRRIFSREIKLNVLSLQESGNLDLVTVWQDLNLNKDAKRGSLQLFDDVRARSELDRAYSTDSRYVVLGVVLDSFTQAKTFGSLIDVPMEWEGHLRLLMNDLEQLVDQGEPIQKASAKQILPLVYQAWILAQRYDVVIANPPYMTSKYQTQQVKVFIKNNFDGFDKDLFSAFIARNLQLTKNHGQLGFMTPFVWMFISSYEQLRAKLIDDEIISSLIQLEYSGFDGATVPICAFTLTKGHIRDYVGCYIRLSNFKGHKIQAPKVLEAISNPDCGWLYHCSQLDFKVFPGNILGYWLGKSYKNAFLNGSPLFDVARPLVGLQTSDNDRFLRFWYEVALDNTSFDSSDASDARNTGRKWFPHVKGGGFRRWFGFNEYVLNWKDDGIELKESIKERLKATTYTKEIRSEKYYFLPNLSWGAITSGKPSFRFTDKGSIFNIGGPAIFPSVQQSFPLGAFLNSLVAEKIFSVVCTTLNLTPGDIGKIPIYTEIFNSQQLFENGNVCKEISKSDWNMFEISWGFEQLSIQTTKSKSKTLADSYHNAITGWQLKCKDMQRLEQENNRILIDAYGLQDELTPDVPIKEITLTCNPRYRYGGDATDNELNSRQQSDTIVELISYSIGCMMGRYSLDREGLVYAHAGNQGFAHLVSDGAYQSYRADDDGILPLTDQEWFEDDITNRFRDFIRTAWSAEHLQENLAFVAESLGLYAIKPKRGESSLETIRRYLSTQFYKDHLKTYKKRPIYWLFSSGKLKAFECLVYLHRYNESTLSRMRTEYVTPLIGKYAAHAAQLQNRIDNSSSTAETSSLKSELTTLEKKQAELHQFDDKLKYYANMGISIDLDDGVKVNYGKFGDLLSEVKAITGDKGE